MWRVVAHVVGVVSAQEETMVVVGGSTVDEENTVDEESMAVEEETTAEEMMLRVVAHGVGEPIVEEETIVPIKNVITMMAERSLMRDPRFNEEEEILGVVVVTREIREWKGM